MIIKNITKLINLLLYTFIEIIFQILSWNKSHNVYTMIEINVHLS